MMTHLITVTVYPTPRILPLITQTHCYVIIGGLCLPLDNPNRGLFDGSWWYNLEVDEPSGFIQGENNDTTSYSG